MEAFFLFILPQNAVNETEAQTASNKFNLKKFD